MINKIYINELTTGFLEKRGKEKILHQGLNLSLTTGRVIGILGPNGAGKSTLLKTLLGFHPALSGKVLYGTNTLQQLSARELAKMVSVVLTTKIDDLFLTAFEIVMTGRYPFGSFTGRISGRDREIIRQAMEKVGVSHYASRKFISLSDGEKQKVMIARAIAQDTPFIFLDEPVAFIDAPSRIGIMQLLQKLAGEMDKGILMATHDLDAAIHYADELWLLGSEGRWETGNPKELVSRGRINIFFDQENITFNKDKYRFEWTEK